MRHLGAMHGHLNGCQDPRGSCLYDQTDIPGIVGGTGTRTIGQYSRLQRSQSLTRETEWYLTSWRRRPDKGCAESMQGPMGHRSTCEACQWEMGWQEERGK